MKSSVNQSINSLMKCRLYFRWSLSLYPIYKTHILCRLMMGYPHSYLCLTIYCRMLGRILSWHFTTASLSSEALFISRSVIPGLTLNLYSRWTVWTQSMQMLMKISKTGMVLKILHSPKICMRSVSPHAISPKWVWRCNVSQSYFLILFITTKSIVMQRPIQLHFVNLIGYELILQTR